MDVGTDHRHGSDKRRNGRSRYEKGREQYRKYADKKLVKGYRGSMIYAPERETDTLADVWPIEMNNG